MRIWELLQSMSFVYQVLVGIEKEVRLGSIGDSFRLAWKIVEIGGMELL